MSVLRPGELSVMGLNGCVLRLASKDSRVF